MTDSRVFLIETTANLMQKEQSDGLYNHVIHPYHYRLNFPHPRHGDGYSVGFVALSATHLAGASHLLNLTPQTEHQLAFPVSTCRWGQ